MFSRSDEGKYTDAGYKVQTLASGAGEEQRERAKDQLTSQHLILRDKRVSRSLGSRC